MLRYSLKQDAAAKKIEDAVAAVLGSGKLTADLAQGNPKAQVLGTSAMGDAIVAALQA